MSIFIFIIIIAVLIFVHEFGHFITAKWAKLRVDEFGFGFPPRIIGKKVGETIYSINAIPFGGFVKIFGEDGEGGDSVDSFASKPAWIRFIILFAGAAMNFLLGWLLIALVFSFGTTMAIDDSNRHLATDIGVMITNIAPSSPAEEAGLRPGDRVKRVSAPDMVKEEYIISNDRMDITVDLFVMFVNEHAGKDLRIRVMRGDEELTITAHARQEPPEGEGALGVAVAETGVVQYSPGAAAVESAKASWRMSGAVLSAFGNIAVDVATGKGVSGDIVGPVGIVSITADAYRIGFANLVQLVALISLNLAVLNLLPIPALDGGRILFLGIEKIKGSPVPKEAEKWIHAIGFMLLILLLIAVTIKDVAGLL